MRVSVVAIILLGSVLLSCSSGNNVKHEEKRVRQISILKEEAQKPLVACARHDDCSSSQICDDGICMQGECTTSNDEKICHSLGTQERGCCEPWETCSTMNNCYLPANSAVASQCASSTDCSFGKFCSSGHCLEIKGRSNCTSSFQCSAAERCDLQVHLCVPEKGGCQFCSHWPELCCENNERCDSRTDRCVRAHGQECNESNVEEVCRRNQLCYEGRCVQCVSDEQCGPGTKCDLEQGICYSVRNRCSSDQDCEQQQRCLVSERLCVIPRCRTDEECQSEGSGMKCDLAQFKCVRPR